MADPAYPSPEDVKNAEELYQSMQSINESYTNLLKLSKQIGDSLTVAKVAEIEKAANAKRLTDGYVKQIAELRKLGQLSKDQAKTLKEQAKIEAEMTAKIQQQNMLEKIAIDSARQKLGLLREELKTEKQIADEAMKQAKAERDTALSRKLAGANQAVRSAEDVGGGTVRQGVEAAGAAFGPIGTLVTGLFTTLLGFLSQSEKYTAKILRAGVATGKFVDNFSKFGDFNAKIESLRLNATGLFDKTGLHWKEMADKMAQAAGAGIQLSTVFDVQKITRLSAAANSIGVDFGTYTKTLVDLRRTLQGSNDASAVSEKLARTAQTIARADIMNANEFIATADSMADEFSDLNISFEQTADLTRDLMLNVKNLGVTAKVAKDVTNQLAKSFKSTSDEWKAFVGSKSGFGGGFLGGLFGAQQRGAGGDLLTREADPRKWITQVMQTVKGQTAGIADPRARTFMAEQLGKNFGLDAKSTQALLKGITGNTAEQADAIEEMVSASKEAEEKSKDWAERLAPMLEKFVANFLKTIVSQIQIQLLYLKIIAQALTLDVKGAKKSFGDITSKGKEMAMAGIGMAQAVAEGGHYVSTGQYSFGGGRAGGGTVPDTGLILAHRDEEVLSPNVAREYRQNRGRQGGNGGINVNVVVNNANIDKAFEQAKQDTKRQLKKMNAYAWGM